MPRSSLASLASLISLLPPLPPSGAALTCKSGQPGQSGAVVMALVGGGGKTTLLFALAGELHSMGYRVISTTTTKIFPPVAAQSPCLLLKPGFAELTNALETHGHVTVGAALLPEGKVGGMTADAVDRLAAQGAADVILVEADGAAGLPLKAPAVHEPVIPSSTKICCALWNCMALGFPCTSVVHRPERAQILCGIGPEHVVQPAHVAEILLHPDGCFRTAPPGAALHVLCVGGAEDRANMRSVMRTAQARYPGHTALWWACAPCEGWAERLDNVGALGVE